MVPHCKGPTWIRSKTRPHPRKRGEVRLEDKEGN